MAILGNGDGHGDGHGDARRTGQGLGQGVGQRVRSVAGLTPAARRRERTDREARAADAEMARARTADCVVDFAAYAGGRRLDHVETYADALSAARHNDGFVWIGLFEPSYDQLDAIAAFFGLHPLAVEDAVRAHQRPKLERYDADTFVTVKTVRYVEHEALTSTSEIVETGEVAVFLGPDYVVTVRHGAHHALGALRRRLEEEPERLALGPSVVLHAIVDSIVDDYLQVVQEVQDDIDEIETIVFSQQGTHDVGRIYQLKREMIQLKRATMPLMTPLQRLVDGQVPGVPGEIRQYFRDVQDHLARVNDRVQGFDELLTSIVQANLAIITTQDNSDMRKISAWAAIAAVWTAIAGVYGMNFRDMPELGWRYGYPLVLAIMVAISVLLYRGFKRSGWL